MKTLLSILVVIFLTLVFGPFAQAQSGNYVVSARLHFFLNEHEIPDVYLNGLQIVNSNTDALMFAPKMDIVRDLPAAQLCYFQTDNVIAIDLEQILTSTEPNSDYPIGLAFTLAITLSDNSVVWITSNDGKIKQTYVPNGGAEPGAWAAVGTDDSGWKDSTYFTPAKKADGMMSDQTNTIAQSIMTFNYDGGLPAKRGDKFFFRRSFSLNVTTRPGCVPPRAPRKPTATPTFTFTPAPPTATFTAAPPTATHTPRPRPTASFTPLPPKPTHTPVPPPPTATPRPMVRRVPPTATDTPMAAWTDTPVPPAPTHTPRPRRRKPTATPTEIPEVPTATYPPLAKPTKFIYARPTATRTPVPVRRKRPTATPTAPPVLVPTFTPPPPEDMGMAATIVFVNPPVNIDASFADGPGYYKLEIVDADGGHVNTLYNKHVGFEKETWISWDGTNDQGQLMHYGTYFALFTKDGKLIQKIALTWIPPGTKGSTADE